MKVFIWSSEYIAHIALAETKEEALELLKKEVENQKLDEYDKKAFLAAIKNDPVIIKENSANHLNHSNE